MSCSAVLVLLGFAPISADSFPVGEGISESQEWRVGGAILQLGRPCTQLTQVQFPTPQTVPHVPPDMTLEHRKALSTAGCGPQIKSKQKKPSLSAGARPFLGREVAVPMCESFICACAHVCESTCAGGGAVKARWGSALVTAGAGHVSWGRWVGPTCHLCCPYKAKYRCHHVAPCDPVSVPRGKLGQDRECPFSPGKGQQGGLYPTPPEWPMSESNQSIPTKGFQKVPGFSHPRLHLPHPVTGCW